MTGSITFEQRVNAAGVERTVIAGTGIAMNIGAASGATGATLSEGEGAFVLLGGVAAGYLSGKASISLGGLGAGAQILVRINNVVTGAAVDETVVVGGRPVTVKYRPRS